MLLGAQIQSFKPSAEDTSVGGSMANPDKVWYRYRVRVRVRPPVGGEGSAWRCVSGP